MMGWMEPQHCPPQMWCLPLGPSVLHHHLPIENNNTKNHFKLYETRIKKTACVSGEVGWFLNNRFEECGRNQLWSNLTYNPDTFLGVQQKLWRTPVRIATLTEKCELWFPWVCIKQKCWPQDHITIMHLSDLSLLWYDGTVPSALVTSTHDYIFPSSLTMLHHSTMHEEWCVRMCMHVCVW
jgi:hypothetical protein